VFFGSLRKGNWSLRKSVGSYKRGFGRENEREGLGKKGFGDMKGL
jgi:hypothetical protein